MRRPAPTPESGVLGVRHREVERLRRLLRRADARASESAFVIEGPKLLEVALEVGADLEAVYVAEDARSVDDVVARARAQGVPIRVLASGVLERVADTVTPQPVLTVARSVTVPVEAVVTVDFMVVVVDVQDPGNAGTIIRSAEAAGAGAVLFTGASVDPLSPKTVRASAGAVFQIAVVDGGEPAAMLDQLGAQGVRRLGAAGHGGDACDQVDLTGPVALVLGNEAHGLPAGLPLDGMVSIPMAGSAESLNVGMAASILCYEVARQRRSGRRDD